MNAQLHSLFNALENQRFKLLTKVKANPEKFDLKPDAQQWSVHQVLAHLIMVEKLSLQYISKKYQGIGGESDTGLVEAFKMLAVKASLRLPFKFKAPAFVVEKTTTYKDLDTLIHSWDESRKQMKDMLARFQDDQLNKKVYRHVAVGKLNIVQALTFLADHFHHHIPQLNRLLKQLSFSKRN